jgi:hypothetical protein
MTKNWNLRSLPDKILVNNTFYLSPREKMDSDKFQNRHSKCNANYTFLFSCSSGIGINVLVECVGCGSIKDITDTNYW